MKINLQQGQASRLLMVLAIVVLVAVIIVYLVMKMASPTPKPVTPATPEVVLPVYEYTLNNIRFVFQSAIDRGQVLKLSTVKTDYDPNRKDYYISNSGAKFIQVTVGAQNKGTENTDQNSWTIENIVDSEGRNFVPVEDYNINAWLPKTNQCGALLKPAFDPVPCTKIYEVSKESTGLKITIRANKKGGRSDSSTLDLIVK